MTALPLVYLYDFAGITVTFHALSRSELDFRDDDVPEEVTELEYDSAGRWTLVRLDPDADGNPQETHRRTYTSAGQVESETREYDEDDDGVVNHATIDASPSPCCLHRRVMQQTSMQSQIGKMRRRDGPTCRETGSNAACN